MTQEFLQQVLQEYDRRTESRQPRIEQISPDELQPGETTEVKITGENLDQVDSLTVPGNTLVEVTITEQTPEQITADFIISPDHPPQPITDFRVKDNAGGEYNIQPKQPPQVSQVEALPNFDEIEGFQQAVELILSGQYGTPNDFLYWLAQQRPRQFRVERSDLLDDLVNQGTLFEHQKSGAQHCLRVMQDFGISVCADAVGLGKTRLAAAVSRLYRSSNGQAKIAIVAARKLHDNWNREMTELGFSDSEYELYNKNLMSRKGNGFIDDFNRYGGPDLVIIDEAHEGIRNYKNRIHKLCLQIRERDRASGRQRHFLLLTATPWNNRREDIYNILQPFLTRPEGFTEAGFPPQLADWFKDREIGVEPFTDDKSGLFRRTYRELFLQRTRQMLRDAMPDLNVYAKRQAEWLPVQFEDSTEAALEQIFTQFETQLYIPFADPVRYLTGSVEQRGLLQNQRRFFLQRAESSMYALRRTIVNFTGRIEQMQSRLSSVTPDAKGLQQFILLHYGFESDQPEQLALGNLNDREAWDEDYEENEDDDEETVTDQQEKRQQLRRTIDLAIGRLHTDPVEARRVYNLMWSACDNDLMQIQEIQALLADEFVKDHKREQVTRKVRELVSQGKKVLLISIFSDTVIDYYRYMTQDASISSQGIGMAIGSTKRYYPSSSDRSFQVTPLQVTPHNAIRSDRQRTGIKRQELFRLFAPVANCKSVAERPSPDEEVMVLIGSETLSVGQNLQDADYLINIDLPWNPMTLEQRIGRIDRPKQHPCETLHIYYANSESQLLRQASRLANLNKKLIGENQVGQDGVIQDVPNVDELGPSIYGDTLFDDTILPGYVAFIRNLVVARRQTQESFQETLYRASETSRDLYTQQEIVFSEDISQRLQIMGDDYLANPIALGRKTGEKNEPTGLVALTLKYLGPNGEVISDRQELLFWNDQTGERDGYGTALSTAVKTPEAIDVFSAKHLRTSAQKLYTQLVELKRQRSSELAQPETLENVTITSERLNKIQQRISNLDALPDGLDRKAVKDTLKKLNTWKGIKSVQKILRDYTDGTKAQLDALTFVTELVKDTDEKNLIVSDSIKPTLLTLSLSAMLLRA